MGAVSRGIGGLGMGFSEWYKSEFPDLDPDQDDMYLDLEHAWNNGYSGAKNAGWQPIGIISLHCVIIQTRNRKFKVWRGL